MNKDALLATLIGFAIGIGITAIVLVGPSFFKGMNIKLPSISLFKQSASTPTPTPTPTEFMVTIDGPLPESIESEKEVLVSGTSATEATVVIQGPVDDEVVVTNGDGKYAGKITLVEGKNDIVVTSYLKEKRDSKTVTVYYTAEELE